MTTTIESDNVGALFMGAQMHSKASPITSKEVALLYSETSFEPRRFDHIPGVANGLADELSRLCEPDSPGAVPEGLLTIEPTIVPIRAKDYYKVLTTA